ncbi:hypothetical protein [Roseobacter ponti]|uniref:Uncharacterized protein n=1 Tax=Roseobacter ponti TaxID=1891787 RepID=A0A858SWL6_9RHOB|nr:hypothetical protein [Roseobacter ponti]QJF52212.1 hypothetical protein G3256_14030 [Roseobacter ponti]
MLKYLQISVASLALSVFAVAPAVVVITADTAVAKSDNGNGGGNKGNGGGGGAKGKSGDKGKSGAAKSNKGNKGGKSTASRGKAGTKVEKSLNRLGNKVKNGFGLFDGLKKNNRTAKASGTKTNRGIEKAFDHPSNLGKMNGAINSSPNAKLAHIRNGNFNGPVGVAAAYAVADAQYADAAEAYADAEARISELTPVSEAFGYIETYNQAVADLEDGTLTPDDEGYEDAVDLVNDTEALQNAEDTIADAREQAEDPDSVTAENVQAALDEASDVEEPDRMALDDAETNLLGLYKGDEESLDDVQKKALIDSVNLPTRDQVRAVLPQEDADTLPAEDPDTPLTDDETAETLDDAVEVIEES